MTALLFGFGFLIGVAITMLIFSFFIVGTLRIDRSDPEDGPYLFLELERSVNNVASKKYVLMKVKDKNYIS